MAGEPILRFSDVHTYYGPLHVLKGVSYEIYEGEIVSLLGGNASGKSTTMLEVAKQAQAGKLQGKSYVIGVENEKAAGYGKFGDPVPQKVKDKVAEAKKLMVTTCAFVNRVVGLAGALIGAPGPGGRSGAGRR